MRHQLSFGRALALVWILLWTSGPSAAAEEPDDNFLIEMETASWEAWKAGDGNFFETHLDDDGVLIMGHGRRIGKAAAVEQVAEVLCDVASFELSNFHVHSLGADTKILSYEARQDAICDGERVAENLLVSSIYDLVDGKWANVHYQETVRLEDDEAQ